MKFIVLPQYSLMIWSLMGSGFNSSLTREYSCSGPRTSSGLYVGFPHCLGVSVMRYVGVSFKFDCRKTLDCPKGEFLEEDCRQKNGQKKAFFAVLCSKRVFLF